MLIKGIFNSAMAALLASTATVAYAAAPPPANDGMGLEEVVVTATKRAENLQTVPLSITSLSSKQLQQQGVVNFVDYATQVPNMAFAATGDGVAASRTISIRGISGDGTTGFYIDETPVIDSIDPKIIGVDHIEVLRGPQGTLYGARSMGGTVRIITKQPDDSANFGDVHGGISNTRLGGWNYFGDAAANLVVVPNKVAIRAVGHYSFDQGWFKRAYPDAVDPSVTDIANHVANNKTYGGSLSAKIKASEELTITPRVMYQKTTYNGLPLAMGVLNADSSFQPLNDSSYTYNEASNTPEGGYDRWALYSLDVKYNASFGTFSSSSSYFDRYSHETESQANFISFLAGLPIPGGFGIDGYQAVPSPITENKSFKRFVQEFRFISSFDGPLQLTAGLYYASTKTSVIYPPATVPGLSDAAGIPDNAVDLIFESNTTDKITEPAVYGELSYAMTDKLKATVGARFYKVKDQNQRAFANGLAEGSYYDPAPESISQSGVTPKFNLQYQATPDDMIYATVAKGFRPGGIVPGVPSVPAGSDPADFPIAGQCQTELQQIGFTQADTRHFKSDSLWNYEVGAKTSWLDNRLSINASGFYIKWSNIQQQILLGCGFQFRTNAGAAESKGAELEVRAHPARGLDLNFNMGYQDAKITSNPLAAQGAPLQPGDRVYNTPKWTISGGVTYTVPLADDYSLVTNGTYSFVGNSVSANNDPANPRLRPSYTLLDARIGVAKGNYELTAFGKNLTDEHANFADNRSIAAETPGEPRVVTNQPRTFGIEFRAHFQ